MWPPLTPGDDFDFAFSGVAFDRNEGVVKRHLFTAMLFGTGGWPRLNSWVAYALGFQSVGRVPHPCGFQGAG